MSYLKRHGTRRVPQWAPLEGQDPNSAGGFAWAVDTWARLRRFLVLGSEGGSYYASEWTLTRENAQAVEAALRKDARRAVAELVAVSRTPKNDPALFALAMAGETDGLPRLVEGFVRVKRAETALVREYGLPREALQPEQLTSPDVWEALLEDMPMTAMVRNLATMTRVGVVSPGSAGTAKVVAQLGDAERSRAARVHPIALLTALRTYQAGRGARGRHEWNPVREVVNALDAAFYTAFGDYRRASGIDARLVVVGLVSNGFSIADPADPGMLDVVGFDTATAQLISDFARGAL